MFLPSQLLPPHTVAPLVLNFLTFGRGKVHSETCTSLPAVSPGRADKLGNTDSWFICNEAGNRNVFPATISESDCLSSLLKQSKQLGDYNEQQGNLLLPRSALFERVCSQRNYCI